MDSEMPVQFITIDEPILPVVAARITDEQRAYNPTKDEGAANLEFEAMLYRAGLDNYASIIMSDHGIADAREFSELQETDIKLFCKVARDH